jgi:glutathione synthase/RimK-type ligase-like ATP-grasp enzyme
LANLLGAKRITEFSKPRRSGIVINWGKSTIPQWRINNAPYNPIGAVGIASNKIETLQACNRAGVPHVPFTTDRRVAANWLSSGECKIVYCRTIIRGYGGAGIVLARKPEELVNAPLYTKGIKKDREFRIHVMNGQVIFQQEKKMMAKERRPDGFNSHVRNHANGWVFTDQNLDVPAAVVQVAARAVLCCGLDFGAVDCIWNNDSGAHVLEVNTAIGMQPKLANIYAAKLKEFYLGPVVQSSL